jgi:calcineurin-like phosphoesterase family protein
MLYFTADLHFNHRNIIDFCGRPFSEVAEMNAAIVDGINRKVGKTDELYIVGDFGLHVKADDVKDLLGKITCRSVRLVFGNHDDSKHGSLFQHSYDMVKVNWNKQSFLLCHYPLRSWRAAYQLHGHEHGRMKHLVGQLDIGVDGPYLEPNVWRGEPWSAEEVVSFVNARDKDRIVTDACVEKHRDRLVVGGYTKDGRSRFAGDGRD